jgi:hypothetical protein
MARVEHWYSYPRRVTRRLDFGLVKTTRTRAFRNKGAGRSGLAEVATGPTMSNERKSAKSLARKLADTQLVLVSAGAQRDDNCSAPTRKLKGRAAQKVVEKLTKMVHREAIDSGHPCNCVRTLDAFGSFNLAKKRAAAIGGYELIYDRVWTIQILRDLQFDATSAVRRILHRVDDVIGFLGVANQRKHEALGAHVHGARDMVVLLQRNSRDFRRIRCLELADRALHRLESKSGMLQIEEHEIAAG